MTVEEKVSDRRGDDRGATRHRSSATIEGGSHDWLHFAVSSKRPLLQGVSTYAILEREFLDREFVFSIIGQSHYIYTAAGDFHEVCSCVPVAVDSDVATTDKIGLRRGHESTFSTTIDGVLARTNATVEAIDEFPEDREFHLSHRFAPNAFTTITIGETDYTTWHTYPDRGVAVHTRTDFER